MGSTELAANLFRATQTDEKLRREKIYGVSAACNTHFAVGQQVRQTIAELGGTMPEDLPTPDRSIAQIEREQNKKIKEQFPTQQQNPPTLLTPVRLGDSALEGNSK